MRSYKVRILLFLICFAIMGQMFGGQDNPLLWEVDTEPPSYIFGTIHYPDKRIANPGELVFSKLENCSTFVMEATVDASAVQKIMNYAMLSDSLKLGDILPKPLYQKADSILVSMGQSIAMYSMLKPWMLTMTLSMPPTENGEEQILPMDLQLQEKAKKTEKKILGLETIEEQISIFDNQSYDEQVKMLQKTIEEYESYKKLLDKMIDAYQDGDLKELHRLINYWSVDQEDKEFINEILYKRNKTMFASIEEYFENSGNKNYFIAVGAGHLSGEKGLLKLLEREGYDVTRVEK